MEPGNLQGGFDWYLSVAGPAAPHDGRHAPRLPPIDVPTRVLWGQRGSDLRAALDGSPARVFSRMQASVAEDAGHFVHWERPDLAAAEIRAFFAGLS